MEKCIEGEISMEEIKVVCPKRGGDVYYTKISSDGVSIEAEVVCEKCANKYKMILGWD